VVGAVFSFPQTQHFNFTLCLKRPCVPVEMGLVDWLLFFLELWLKYYLFKIIFLMFLNCFDVYISKINFKKKNNIILIYFQIKNVTINTITLITLAWRLNDTGYFYFGVVLSCSIFSMFIKKKIKSFFIRKKKRVWHDTLKISMPKSPFDLVFANWSWLLLLLLFLTFYFFFYHGVGVGVTAGCSVHLRSFPSPDNDFVLWGQLSYHHPL
jgi:hypothetical protein